MSKTSQAQQMYCEACGKEVSLKRGNYRQLKVSCACDERDVKVAKATPFEWEP